jgi:polysaccharide biosynthesis/export protein
VIDKDAKGGWARSLRVTAAVLILALGAVSLPPVPAAAQEYTARIGDVLDIVVVGEPDFSRTVTVSQEGSIFLPLVGNIGVQGLTIQQITSKVAQALSQYVKEPKVLVTFRQSSQRDQVFVLGQVVHPGPFEWRQGITVLELLALSGGATDRAALRRALVMRKSVATPVDLEKLMGGDVSLNATLSPGDVLVVPDNTGRVLVVGEVTKPGYVTLAPDAKILDVITLAGGPTLSAAPERISILREGQPLHPNLEALLRDGKLDENVVVQPGDIVDVPTTDRRVLVLGRVVKPGPYLINPDFPMSILDVIAQAGGPADNSKLNTVYLIRQSGTAAPVATEIDMWKYLHHGGANADLRLRPGDVIFVPTSPIVGVSQILSALSGLAYFSTIFLPCGSVLGCGQR